MERSGQLLVVGLINSLLLAAILTVLLLRDTSIVLEPADLNNVDVTTERGRLCAEKSGGMLAYFEYQECVLGP